MGLGPLFNMKAWDNVARQAMIRYSLATQRTMLSFTGSLHHVHWFDILAELLTKRTIGLSCYMTLDAYPCLMWRHVCAGF